MSHIYHSPVKSLLLLALASATLCACGGNSPASNAASPDSKQLQPSSKAAAPVAGAASAYQKLVQELFILYYGRPADPASLATYESNLLAASAPADIADLLAAYSSNTAVKTMIDTFGASTESQAYFNAGNNSAYVTAVYQKVLGQTPSATSLAYWSNPLNAGSMSQGRAALGIMAAVFSDTSAQGIRSDELITNRSLTATYFTADVAASHSAVYSGSAALSTARTMLGGIAWNSSASTCAAAARTAVANLIPYTVSGTVSGLTGSGLVLLDNGGNNLSISGNGSFTFSGGLTNGGPYAVTVQTQPGLPAQSCMVTNGAGTIAGAAVSNVQVACADVVPTATGDSRAVTQPTYPAVCATVYAQFDDAVTLPSGASPASDDTSRLQTALSNCAGTGQSVVLAASGSNNAFYSNSLNVSGEGLVVDSDVTLYGSDGYVSNPQLIDITGVNASLMGPGKIDGRGGIISTSSTPRLVQASAITNFIVYNVTLANALHPNLYVEGGNGFTAWGITILTSPNQANADGIDIDSLTNASVINSSITDGDDGIALKTNSGNISNITISGNNLYGTHGLSVGSIDANTVSNILFENNYVYGAGQAGSSFAGIASTDANAINIKTGPCALTVTNVTYLNTCIKDAKHLIAMETNYNTCTTGGSPLISNIVVNGVTSSGSVSGAYTELYGFGAGDPIYAYFANINLDATAQSSDQYANVILSNSNDTPSGNGVTTSSPISISGSAPSCSFSQ